MKAEEARAGRVFVLRLEDGDRLPEAIERFCAEAGVQRGVCWMVGGAGAGRVVVGPETGDARPIVPMVAGLDGVHEAAAVGTIFPDDEGAPRLHMHAALGRSGRTVTGCVRLGVEVWELGEVVLLEIEGSSARRRLDPSTGFSVLVPGGGSPAG